MVTRRPVTSPRRVGPSGRSAHEKSSALPLASARHPDERPLPADPSILRTTARSGARRPLPATDAVADRVVTLPLYPHMNDADVAAVTAAVQSAIRIPTGSTDHGTERGRPPYRGQHWHLLMLIMVLAPGGEPPLCTVETRSTYTASTRLVLDTQIPNRVRSRPRSGMPPGDRNQSRPGGRRSGRLASPIVTPPTVAG